MSRTPNGDRRRLDAYFTPPTLALAIVRWLADLGMLFDGARVLEPHVGEGTFVEALLTVAMERSWTFTVYVLDIDPEATGLKLAAVHATVQQPGRIRWTRVVALPAEDFLSLAKRAARGEWKIDIAIGNPPYSVVEDGKKRGEVVAHLHVDAARSIANVAAFVLRTGLFTTSAGRPWGRDNPPFWRGEVWPRPSFTEGRGTDACEYVVGVWADGAGLVVPPGGYSQSLVLDWRELGAARAADGGGAGAAEGAAGRSEATTIDGDDQP